MNPSSTPLTACPEYIDRLVDLSDGELTVGERAAVEAHLAGCAGCRAELCRLDVSLAELRQAIVPVSPVNVAHRGSQLRTALIAAGAMAAAIALVISVAAALKVRTGASRDAIVEVGPSSLQPAPISRGDALRQIALLEQEARLAMSLALLPEGDSFAAERAANEELLATFRRESALPQ